MTPWVTPLIYLWIIFVFSIVFVLLLVRWGWSLSESVKKMRIGPARRDLKFDETDLRLTYKRFMELYPYSEITYTEYKKMQAERAYKKATSSTKIKRMVR